MDLHSFFHLVCWKVFGIKRSLGEKSLGTTEQTQPNALEISSVTIIFGIIFCKIFTFTGSSLPVKNSVDRL